MAQERVELINQMQQQYNQVEEQEGELRQSREELAQVSEDLLFYKDKYEEMQQVIEGCRG